MRSIVSSTSLAALALIAGTYVAPTAPAAAADAPQPTQIPIPTALALGPTAPALGELRAGAPLLPGGLGELERASLRAAEQRSVALGQLRAGDLHLTDDELMIALIAAGVVLLIIIIA